MSDVLWRRLGYMLSPQLDIYQHLAPLVKNKRVIDIGCGTGFGTLQLLGSAESLIGVDVDSDAINFAKNNIPIIRWEWGDISRTVAYLGRDYDAVLMIEVLEHVSEWEIALHNVCEILKADGKLYISARNANADLRKNDLHEREWTAEQLYNSLRRYFKDVNLYDYRLQNKQELDTRQTPLIAVASRKDR